MAANRIGWRTTGLCVTPPLPSISSALSTIHACQAAVHVRGPGPSDRDLDHHGANAILAAAVARRARMLVRPGEHSAPAVVGHQSVRPCTSTAELCSVLPLRRREHIVTVCSSALHSVGSHPTHRIVRHASSTAGETRLPFVRLETRLLPFSISRYIPMRFRKGKILLVEGGLVLINSVLSSL
jgi:hypothetical protein